MNKLTISIYRNEIFTEVINEIDLFSKFKIKSYNDLNLCIKDTISNSQLIIFFLNEIKFAAQKHDNPEITVRLVAKLAQLDEIITHIKDANSIAEYGSRGIVDQTSQRGRTGNNVQSPRR